ncbi:32117_t:CDS:2 [Racocetra persica]|uniref:32117_t:CDS:1 n=1 Tax=Racocetra persica TaxID=160502 RepID=A0ACA9KNS4_9GLOM|nr:32117_t:CDS:2 [Racocetra persica]
MPQHKSSRYAANRRYYEKNRERILKSRKESRARTSNLKCTKWVDQEKYKPSYNVSPTYYEPVVRADSELHENVIHSMKWGLVPSWAKDKSKPSTSMQSINCRDDSLYEVGGKPMFKSLKNKNRCIVIAQGKDEKLLLFAGLYKKVQLEDGDTLYTYTIITTSASKSLSFIHDRMPVILENDSDCLAKWLDPNIGWNSELEELLKSYEGELECHPVSQDVGKVSNDYPSLIQPIAKANIANFFSVKKDEIKDEGISNSKPIIKDDVDMKEPIIKKDSDDDDMKEPIIKKEDDVDMKESVIKKEDDEDMKESVIKIEDDDDMRESTSSISTIPSKRSLDDLKDDIKDEFLSDEGNDLKRSRKLTPSPPDEKPLNDKDLDTDQLHTSTSMIPKKRSLNFTAQKPNSTTKKSKTKATDASTSKGNIPKKKQKAKDKAEGSAKITSFFSKSAT